jgi:hypothetical protein
MAFRIAETMAKDGLERWMDWRELHSLDAPLDACVSHLQTGARDRRLASEMKARRDGFFRAVEDNF